MAPAPEPDSETLFEGCRAGEPEAIAAAYDRWGNQLYGTALRMLTDPAEAEEIVQESFVTLIEKAPGLEIRNLGGWLHRVTVNGCLDRIRRRRPSVDIEESPARIDPPRSRGPALDLEAAVATLPDGAREIFLLHDVEGFKHREIAELLDISAGTSKSQLFRARKLLRAELKEAAS